MSGDIILSLGKALRYRPLPQLVNRKVVINSVADIEEQVKKALAPDIPKSCRLDCNPAWMECTIAKGILDLTFLAPDEVLDSACASGLSVLQDLRLIYSVTRETLVEKLRARLRGIDPPPTLGIPGYITDGDLSPESYEQLLHQVLNNQPVIRLFMRGEHPRELVCSGALTGGPNWDGATIPDGYFPHCFDVTDACIANARSVWMSRHWYM